MDAKLLIGTLCVAAFAGAGGHDKTPDGTVKAFFEAESKEDYVGLFSRIEGARMDVILPQLRAMHKPPRSGQSSEPSPKITDVSVNGNTATVTVEFSETRRRPAGEDVATLHLIEGDWKIYGGKDPRGHLEIIAEAARDPEKLKKAREAAKKVVVTSNFKQIAIAIEMYVMDYDDKYALTQAKLHSALKPYLKIDAIWKDADENPMDVRLNPWLIGKKDTQVHDPAECVMLSLGPKGHLQTMFGMTPIAFCDGHVKFVTLEQAAKLCWK